MRKPATIPGYFVLLLTLACILGCSDTTDLREGVEPPGQAAGPQPADSASDVPVSTNLTWEPGERSYIYYVYLGTDPDAVANADCGSPEYLGPTTTTTFDPPGDLDYSTTYYWRVDAAHAGSLTHGEVWSFTTSPPPPVAEFSASPTSGYRPLLVSFTDLSTGSITSWAWDFDNDSVVDATVQNPTHVYNTAGTYTVTLTVTGPGGSDTQTMPNCIIAARIWDNVSPAGTEGVDFPSARYSHTMAYDSAREVVVLFGGWESDGLCSDTWEWDGSTWTDVSPGGIEGTDFPGKRYNHAMSYDTAHGVVMMFGGNDFDPGYYGDTWEWDGSAWTNVLPANSPGARFGHAMAYDSARGVVVLFGGYPGKSETWRWDGSNWANVSPGGTEGVDFPTGRTTHAMAYDSAREVVVLFGDYSSGVSDTWEWDGSAWTNVSPAGTPGIDFPCARGNQAMAYNSAYNVVVLFGGNDGSNSYNDTWEWDGSAWTKVFTFTQPSARRYHAMTYDSNRGVVVLFGGYDGSRCSDTWEY